jgi:hypothetical protein
MIHSALIRPSATARNISTALRPGLRRNIGRLPEALYAVAVLGLSMAIWAASMFARPPTSRPPIAFGWPVSEKGPMPGRPMRPVARWQLMMALTLSVPEGLVDALAVAGNDLLRFFEQPEELPDLHGGQPGQFHHVGAAESRCGGKSLGKTIGMLADVILVDCRGAGEMGEQTHEQGHVAIWTDRQVQVGDIGGYRAARVDDHDFHARPGGLGSGEALVDHRMTPGQVGAGQDDQIGKLDILVSTRNGIGTESALMACDRR